MSEDLPTFSEENPDDGDRLRGVAMGIVGLYNWFYPFTPAG
jgi:hypothetical protein